jgi:hypothetical protein
MCRSVSPRAGRDSRHERNATSDSDRGQENSQDRNQEIRGDSMSFPEDESGDLQMAPFRP